MFVSESRSKALAQSAGMLVLLVGVLSFAGWVFGIRPKTAFPGLVAMKANTAVCFILTSISLILQARFEPIPPKRRSLASTLAFLALVMGLLTLIEYVFNWDLGIDQFLFRETLAEAGDSFPGRMAPASACNFILLGVALLTLDVSLSRARRWPAQYFALASAVVSLLAFIGYFYGIELPFQMVPYVTIALHTVLAFWLLSFGVLLARPSREFMAVFTSETLGGILARRMLPAAILVPVLAGWLRVLGQRAGLYGLGLGSSLLATLLIVFFGGLIAWAARALNRVDAEREKGAEALRRGAARLDGIISSAMDAIISIDTEQKVVIFNPAAEKMFQISAGEALGQSIGRFISPPFQAAHAQHIVNFRRTGVSTLQMGALGAVSGLRANGQEFPIEASISQVQVGGENIFTVILRDITERKLAEETLLASREQLRALATRLQSAREQERASLAREIHDVMAQELTRLKLDIVWLIRRLAKPLQPLEQKPLQEKLDLLLHLTDGCIGTVQRLATELRPVVLDTLGLCAAIEWQVRDFESRTGVHCETFLPEENPSIDQDRSIAIFRILQESLTNVARHSGATKVEVCLHVTASEISLTISDNGKGMDQHKLNDPHSVGLLGMRERATLLAGKCHIGPSIQQGTKVEVRLPIMLDHDSDTTYEDINRG